MPNADFNRIIKRVLEILNASPPGTFGASIDLRNKTRSLDAITAAAEEAALTVLQAVAAIPNEFRSAFVTQVQLAHGAFLPAHFGDPATIEIQRYDGAVWREADVKSRTYAQIESYREILPDATGNLYDEIPHNEIGSSLTGYADIWENKFYFTGFAARLGLANVTRAQAAAGIPEVFEATVIKLAIANCPKAGEGNYTMQMANYYGNLGMQDLAAFKAGQRDFAEVSAPAPAKNIHSE